MNILSIETSSVVASVAISNDEGILGEITINHPRTHSQKLMPIIKYIFNNLSLTIGDIDLIVVSNGPGSFTGVRIGLTTAKALAHPNRTPIVTISTLDSLGMNLSAYNGKVISVVDGRRKKVFVKAFKFYKGKVVSTDEAQMGMIDDFLDEWNSKDEEMILVGSGVTENKEYILSNKNEKIALASLKDNFPYAKTLAAMGREIDPEDYQSYNTIEANYIRKSQAEMTLEN
ncbi:MAG TPA: tRNA (adenosine(37)-N6)-threonylcarbamoyltransferase complex dimerization subunit type 1 TsaB [Clostridia bacterium]|nr:tRNA (adenosine(37)-N6)-threonylcarbamoyltransferase complex dimerization subunit type 1 TsaB [Clostridia bacterium]